MECYNRKKWNDETIENAIYDFGIIDELIYEQTETINPYKADTSY